MSDFPRRLPDGSYVEEPFRTFTAANIARACVAILLLGFLALCIVLAQVDPAALINGLPRLLNWAAKAWPPLLSDLDAFAIRGLETVAIATVGTVVATLLAFPLSVFIARNVTPSPALSLPVAGRLIRFVELIPLFSRYFLLLP